MSYVLYIFMFTLYISYFYFNLMYEKFIYSYSLLITSIV